MQLITLVIIVVEIASLVDVECDETFVSFDSKCVAGDGSVEGSVTV